MRRIRLLALGIASFAVALIAAFLSPGTWLNRAIASAMCTVFSFNSAMCTVDLGRSSDRVVAAIPPAIEKTIFDGLGDLLVQRSREFDDDQPSTSPGSNPQAPSFPQDPGPNTPLRRPDFDDDPNSNKPIQPQTNSEPRRLVPGSSSTSNEPCNPKLMTASAQPAQQIIVKGVPSSFNQIAVGVKTREMEGYFPTLSLRQDNGDLSLFVPFHPTDARNGGQVEVLIASGNNVCTPFELNIQALAIKAENTGNTKKILLKSQSFLNRLIQTSNVDQSLLMGAPQNVPEELRLLSLFQWLIDHPQNPNSLRQIAENKAPILEGQKIDYQLLDNLLANTGLNQSMDNLINFVNQKLQSNSENISEKIGLKSIYISRNKKELISLNSSLFGFIGCSPLTVSTDKKLDECMWAQKSWEETSKSKEWESLVSQVKFVLSSFSAVISAVGAFTLVGAPVAAGIVFGASLGLTMVEIFVEANVKLMPSELTKLEFTASPTSIRKDQSGSVTDIRLNAKSGKFPFTVGGLVDLVLNTIGINKYFVRSPKLALSPYKKDINTGLDGLSNIKNVSEAIKSVIEPFFKFFKTEIGGIGPSEYKNIKVDKNYVTSSVGPYGKIRIFGNNEYLGIEKGWTTLILKTLDSKFAGKKISGNQSIEVTDKDDPNPPKTVKTGSSYGDPHIVTFDGYRYSFQTVGEFTLVKSTDGSFEVQVRQSPVLRSQLSLNSAVAIKSGNSRIAIYGQSLPDSDTSTPIRVDGKPFAVRGGTLPNGTVIAEQGQGNYVIQLPTGEIISVRRTQRNNLSYMDVNPSVPDVAGKYVGLLGNSNGNPGDDLQTRSGKVIETKSTYGQIAQTANSFIPGLSRVAGLVSKVENIVFDQLYKEFGNSWRISQAESLFDYKAGQNTDTFSDRGFPSSYKTLNMLSPAQIQTATNACQQAGVSPEQLEGCIFDVGFTGDTGFAQTTAEALNIVNQIKQIIPGGLPIPTRIPVPVKIPGLPF